MERPTLHEIAAMPFPQSVQAIRQHYDKNWGRFENGEPRAFEVTVRYSIYKTGSETYTVEAGSEEEAESKAEELFAAEYGDEAEIDSMEVEAADD